MKKAIFLDRDGTINIEKDYIYKIEDLEFEKGSIKALKTFKGLGYMLIVVTNQSGIARKYFSEDDLHKFNENMNNILKKYDVEIDEFYYCPHHPEGLAEYKKECDCRKPGNELIEEAIEKYNIDRNLSYMVGDKYSDIGAGLKSNLKTVLVRTGYGKRDEEKIDTHKTIVCENLEEFSEILKRKKLSELIKEEYSRDISIANVVMDSREVEKNSLFFAINNGNNFVEEAINKGASLVVCDNSDFKDERVIRVKDSILEMQNLATKYRDKLGIKVIGITGSNGKTTTKDIIYTILSTQYSVLKTEGNYNNHIGLPFTILNLTDEKEVAVLEMGMSHLGEIKRLCEVARPNYAVITNIGESHLEHLKTKENVFKAKTEILEFVESSNTFVCGDDEFLSNLAVYKVGTNTTNNSVINNYELLNEESRFTLDGEKYVINLLGKHNILNVGIAINLCKKFNLSKDNIDKSLKNIEVSNMRFQKIVLGKDIYINDAYNASGISMKAAIDTMENIYIGRYKIAILGDILEAGENEINSHLEILEYLLDKNIKLIYLYGDRMKKAYDIFMEGRDEEYRFWHYPTKEAICESLDNIRMKKLVLLKASRGMELEKIIEMREGKE